MTVLPKNQIQVVQPKAMAINELHQQHLMYLILRTSTELIWIFFLYVGTIVLMLVHLHKKAEGLVWQY
jgi:hypothetical protein